MKISNTSAVLIIISQKQRIIYEYVSCLQFGSVYKITQLKILCTLHRSMNLFLHAIKSPGLGSYFRKQYNNTRWTTSITSFSWHCEKSSIIHTSELLACSASRRKPQLCWTMESIDRLFLPCIYLHPIDGFWYSLEWTENSYPKQITANPSYPDFHGAMFFSVLSIGFVVSKCLYYLS